MSTSLGSAALGLKVNRVASGLSVVVPSIVVVPCLTDIVAPGPIVSLNQTLMLVEELTPTAPAGGSWAVIAIWAAGRVKMTSTM